MNDGGVGSVRIVINLGFSLLWLVPFVLNSSANCPRHLLLYMRVALKRAEEQLWLMSSYVLWRAVLSKGSQSCPHGMHGQISSLKHL